MNYITGATNKWHELYFIVHITTNNLYYFASYLISPNGCGARLLQYYCNDCVCMCVCLCMQCRINVNIHKAWFYICVKIITSIHNLSPPFTFDCQCCHLLHQLYHYLSYYLYYHDVKIVMVIKSEIIWCCHCAVSMWFKLCIIIMLVACPELIHNTESSFPNKYFCYCDSSFSWMSGDRNTHPRPINFILPIYLLYLPLN